jgi:predicted N-acyltransferase
MYTTTVKASIREIDSQAWDHLAGDVFSSHGWLRTVEQTFIGEVRNRYCLVYEHEALVGAAICQIWERSDWVFDLDDCMLGRFKGLSRRLGVSFLPAYVCGMLKGCGENLLVDASMEPDAQRAVSRGLLDAIETDAVEFGVPVAFTNVVESDSDLVEMLHDRGFWSTVDLPVAWMDVCWSSFEEYKAYVKQISGSNRFLRNEISRFRKSGVEVKKLTQGPELGGKLHELLEQNYRVHNGKNYPFDQGFLRTLKENLLEGAVIYLASKEGTHHGVSLMLKRGAVGHMAAIGINHAVAGNDFTYFNLGFYEPIADAIDGRLERLEFGTALYAAKRRRGCRTVDTYLYYKPMRTGRLLATRSAFRAHSAIKRIVVSRKA